MDIEYLLYLQQFRETVGSILTPLMNAVTKLSAGFLPIAMMCMIYWAFDRKAGRKILAGLGGGLFINGFLKLTFCVYRPWIRDTRILPYGDSKTAATGYSFPSGHTTRATAMFGGSGLWFMEKKHSVVAGLLFVLVFLTMFSRNYLGVHTPQDVLVGFISTYSFPSGHTTRATAMFGGSGLWFMEKKHSVVAGLLFVLVFLTMFSRNYLGVHTPQDVLVGFISTAVMMYLTGWLELWSEKEKKRDLMILVAGLLICIAAVLYYEYKPYPLDYLPDGSLLVDPAKMRGDAYEGVGFIASFVICRILEKRQLDFDRISQKLRLFISIFALIPLYWWINTGCPYIIEEISRSLGKFLRFGLGIIYIMVLVPGTVVLAGTLTNRGSDKVTREKQGQP